jgi:L,D-transpeptidase catalytic domain
MRNFYHLTAVGLLNVVLLLAPVFESGNSLKATTLRSLPQLDQMKMTAAANAFEEEVTALYDEINLSRSGLSKAVFEYAYKGYTYLLHHHLLSRSQVLSICDFSQSSRRKRLYVVDLDQKKIVVNTYVAHGRRSGGEYARSFSNDPSSHKSSLGFYVTERTYYGGHGYALKIHGLEKGFNDRADGRNIVVHGSRYVGSGFLQNNRFNGRSFGCPAIPAAETTEVIDEIKGGSCLFIYHPTKKYLNASRILNS